VGAQLRAIAELRKRESLFFWSSFLRNGQNCKDCKRMVDCVEYEVVISVFCEILVPIILISKRQMHLQYQFVDCDLQKGYVERISVTLKSCSLPLR
jgi:hypothetical protein